MKPSEEELMETLKRVGERLGKETYISEPFIFFTSYQIYEWMPNDDKWVEWLKGMPYDKICFTDAKGKNHILNKKGEWE